MGCGAFAGVQGWSFCQGAGYIGQKPLVASEENPKSLGRNPPFPPFASEENPKPLGCNPPFPPFASEENPKPLGRNPPDSPFASE